MYIFLNGILGSTVSLHMAHLQHIFFAGINVIPQYIHCLYPGRFYVRLKSICMCSVLLYKYYIWGDFMWGQRSYINHPLIIIVLVWQYYMGRFYARSEVIHKSPPDYCVVVLNGKILRKKFDLHVKSSHIKQRMVRPYYHPYHWYWCHGTIYQNSLSASGSSLETQRAITHQGINKNTATQIKDHILIIKFVDLSYMYAHIARTL